MVGTIIAVVSSVCTTVIAGFLLYMLQKSDKEKEQLRKQKEEAERKREEDEAKWKETVTQALIQLLRVQLCEYHAKYMEEQSIPTYAYDNWCRMFKQYKELGGNGMVTHMNDDIESLNMKNK